MKRFEGKSVLVTGAASGIGRATAIRLAAEGARLALSDRDERGLRETIGACAGECHLLVYDAADGDASSAMTQQAIAVLGGLDALVCNAGIYRRSRFGEISPQAWDELFSVNLTSMVRIIQTALPLLEQSKGNVIGVASTAGIGGIAYAAHYAASKAAVIGLMKALAVEYAPNGVRFNAVAPGKVKTAITTGLVPLVGQDEALLVRPPKLAGMAQGGDPEDLAAAIAYLASSDARYVSGSVLVIDGAQNIG